MNNEVKQAMSNSLDTEEIRKLCQNKITIHYYKDLANMKNIKEALKPWGKCIFLVETKRFYGHWCEAQYDIDSSTGKKVISWFDSYGLAPDDELFMIPENMRKELNSNKPLFSILCKKSKFDVIYNKYPLQEMKKGVNSCGRFAGLRALFSHWPLDKFISVFKKHPEMTPDEIVTRLTMKLDKVKSSEDIIPTYKQPIQCKGKYCRS